MSKLIGQVAWITGGASGIGLATARLLQAHGATVAVIDLQSSPMLENEMEVTLCDTASREGVDEVTRLLEQRLGPPQILVTCAAITGSSPFSDYPDELWDRIVAVNLTGTYNIARRAFRSMAARRSGRIVLMTSDAALRVIPGAAAYSASKAGVIALGKVLATEGGPLGITCNIVSPGIVDTPTSRKRWKTDAELQDAVTNSRISNVMGAVLTPDDLANTICFLCLPESARITGQTVHVNGGALMC